MKIKALFEIDSVTRTNSDPIQVYPPINGNNVNSPNVGIQTTGRYVIKYKKYASGQFIYSRVNAYQDSKDRIHGIGTLVITMYSKKYNKDIVISATYTIRTADPNNTFTVDRMIGQITAATVDDKLAKGYITFEPVDGGKSYEIVANISCC
jgi:hypothetical protein